MRTPFSYLGNGWTDCTEIWYAVKDLLDKCFTESLIAKRFTEVNSGTLDLFKNNRLLNLLAPQVFSHCCGAQKKACKKLAVYVLF